METDELKFLDLTALTDAECADCGDPPSAGELCAVARSRSSRNLRPLAEDVGVSHVTLLAWERRSDERLVRFWKEQGYRFPDDLVTTTVVLIGKSRTFSVHHAIVDRGAVAEWSGMKLIRRSFNSGRSGEALRPELDEHEYQVDEERGVYRFSRLLHGRRSIAVSYSLR